MVETWEYKVIYFGAERWTSTGLPSDINEKFDEYGSEGWELVATDSITRPSWWFGSGGTTVGIVAFFKRRIGG